MRTLCCPAKWIWILSCIVFAHTTVTADTSVLQRGYTPDVAGANLSETSLTPANVNSASFGRLFSLPVDAGIYAQPLYVPNLTIGGATHNVVFVATMKNSLYAFDADQAGAPLWAINYASTIPGAASAQITDYVGTNSLNIAGPSGIESTPVIDSASNTIYFVTNTKELNNLVFRLHAVDITSGTEKFNGPVIINGSSSNGGNLINFTPINQNQRASLTLANGQVIVAFASHEDSYQYYGWVMSYNASTLALTGTFNPAPANHGGGVWQSGRPPVVDNAGFVYLFTGNGFPDTNQPTADGVNNFAESVVKLDPISLNVVDFFTPDDFTNLDLDDSDISSSGPTLIPGTNVLIGGGKVGTMYLLDTQNLGQLQNNNPGALGELGLANGEIRGGPVVWSRSATAGGPLIYNWASNDALKAFTYDPKTQRLDTTPVMTFSEPPLLFPGGIMALSANGDQNGILWAAINSQGDADDRVAPGELVALNASDLTQKIWTSTDVPGRDDLGLWSKYVPPLVVNGKVYAATQSNQLVVYGLLPTTGAATVTAWPPRQTALGGSANYVVSALTASGSTTWAQWSVSGLPTGASGKFAYDAHGRMVLKVQLGPTTPQGSYRLFATAKVAGIPTSQAVLLDVPDASLTSVATVVADSQMSVHPAKSVIDNNANNFWLTKSSIPTVPYPHSLTLDLGSDQPVTAVSYLPRQDGCVNGTIMQYEVYLSNDGVNWFTQTAGGSFDYGAAWHNYSCNGYSFPPIQTISFPVTNARYIMLNALGSVIDGADWASAAELKVYVANGAVPLQAGDYVLSTRHSGLVITGPTLTAGFPITQEAYSPQNTAQQWRISATPTPGYYKLTNLASIAAGSNLVFDISGNSAAPGALLEFWYDWGGLNQRFNFIPRGDGTNFYAMTNLNSGQCNDVFSYSTDPDTSIGQWPCNYQWNEQWMLSPVNAALP